MKNLETAFNAINSGATMVGLRGYQNQFGEVSDYRVNANVNATNIKKANLAKLEAHTDGQVADIAIKFGVGFDYAKDILDGLIAKAKQNLSENIEDRTIHSQAQTKAYDAKNNTVQVHIESGSLVIYATKISKKVLIEGKYPTNEDRRRLDTKIKDEFRKDFSKQRKFTVGNIKSLQVKGKQIIIDLQ